MPVRMPRCLQVYQLLADGPKTPYQLSILIDNHSNTIHAWLLALQTCGLVEPVGVEDKPKNKRGQFPVLWARTDKRRAPERRPYQSVSLTV